MVNELKEKKSFKDKIKSNKKPIISILVVLVLVIGAVAVVRTGMIDLDYDDEGENESEEVGYGDEVDPDEDLEVEEPDWEYSISDVVIDPSSRTDQLEVGSIIRFENEGDEVIIIDFDDETYDDMELEPGEWEQLRFNRMSYFTVYREDIGTAEDDARASGFINIQS